MIAWLGAALLAGAMVAGAAVALEEAARLLGRPLRWTWLAAMGAAALLPFLSPLVPARVAPATPMASLDPAALQALLAMSPGVDRPAGLLQRLVSDGMADGWLAAGWTIAAVILAGALLLTQRRLHTIRRAGVPARIADVPVLLTRAMGPMVIGLRRPQIVVPSWIDELPPAEQRMVLRHEWEHARAGDTRLLLVGALLVVAMPWNLPLWWMRRRLRQAIEIDCDGRVLAGGADRRAYGSMLIHTAGRPRPAPLLAPGLAELPSLLERRIVAMTHRTPAHRNVRLGTAALLTALLFAAACELSPRSTAPTPMPTEPTLAAVLGADEAEGTVDYAEGAVDAVVMSRDQADSLSVTTVRIRTTDGSLSTGSADPLIIVDGRRGVSLEQVDPDRIASITVLKDAAATAEYGAEGAGGVIVVTTGEAGSQARARARSAAPRVDRVEYADGPAAVAPAAADAEAPAHVYAPGAPVVAPAPRVAEARVMRYVEAPVAAASAAVADVSAQVQASTEAVTYTPAPRPAKVEAVTAIAAPSADGASPAPAAPTVAPMRIRGAGDTEPAPAVSIRARAAASPAAEPLILVDGEVVGSMAELRDRIAPDQIAEITVLKDESATSLYGARGRNGVILVTLKK